MAHYPTPIDEIRQREFPQLEGKVYLDHAGSQLPPKSLIDAFAQDLNSHLYGNPHSESAPAADTGRCVDETRLRTLQFFNADPDEYDLIFVSNATAAIKLVAESFRDYVNQTQKDSQKRGFWPKRLSMVLKGSKSKEFRYLYHKDCHTSLVGIRELSSEHHCFTNDEEVENWIREPAPASQPLTLFAYPGQSNMTGRRLPLDWLARIRSSSQQTSTYTLLDAAALATTKELQISNWKPDFVAVSFYKIFGFPDLGALLVRKSTGARILNARRYFGGGTVEMVIALDDQWHAKKTTMLHTGHEDGTLPFHNIIALSHALDSMKRVYGGMSHVSNFTQSLTRELSVNLEALRYPNGAPVIRTYKDEHTEFGNPNLQGATICFSVLRANGEAYGFKDVERAADKNHIYIRSGTLCNPGGIASYLGWSGEHLRQAYEAGHRCSSPKETVQGKITGVVRASLGACSSPEDITRLVKHIRQTYMEPGIRLDEASCGLVTLSAASKSSASRLSGAIAMMRGSDENIITTSQEVSVESLETVMEHSPVGTISVSMPPQKSDNQMGECFCAFSAELKANDPAMSAQQATPWRFHRIVDSIWRRKR
jgi:molybdenum cofactor sulfurtransferase